MLVRANCILRVGVVGINFKTADLSFREFIARGVQSLADGRAIFFRHPIVLLSTCNRTEVYFSGDDLAEAHSDLLRFLRAQMEKPFEHRLYSYFGLDCFIHLCEVTAGLDSAIIAETEIQRQVKLAYQCAKNLPSALHFIFQKALKIGKTVRNSLVLQKGTATLYGTIWKLAKKALGGLQDKNVLLVGFSETNRGLASFLFSRNVRQIGIATRNPKGVFLEGAVIYGREILEKWAGFDLIVCASNSNGFLIEGVGAGNVVFDLSVPRNVDPEVGKSAFLYNIEQISRMIGEERVGQEAGIERGRKMIFDNVLRLSCSYREKTTFFLENSQVR